MVAGTPTPSGSWPAIEGRPLWTHSCICMKSFIIVKGSIEIGCNHSICNWTDKQTSNVFCLGFDDNKRQKVILKNILSCFTDEMWLNVTIICLQVNQLFVYDCVHLRNCLASFVLSVLSAYFCVSSRWFRQRGSVKTSEKFSRISECSNSEKLKKKHM